MFDMPWQIVDIPLGDEGIQKAWDLLDRNPHIRKLLHNELVMRLRSRQAALETCDQQDLKANQEVVRELKNILSFLHKDESPSARKIYEQTS
jgi:hypothetical protein